MREIKFRAWDKEAKEMREVAMLRWEDGRMSRIAGYWKGTRNNGWTDYDPADGKYELMQFTGLKSKSGIDIYEGDVVKHEQWNNDIMAVVKWKDDMAKFELYWTENEQPSLTSRLANKEYEVIGNIYENPELLSQTQ